MIDAPEGRDRFEQLTCEATSRREGVEHANLDVRVRVERAEYEVLRARVEVVEQHAYAHAAIGGGQ